MISSISYDTKNGVQHKKTIDSIESLSDGFYTCNMETIKFRELVSNIKPSDPKKEISKIELANTKAKNLFTDAEAGGRGNSGKTFQGMVRGSQETASLLRKEKLSWLNSMIKATSISSIVIYDKSNNNWKKINN